MPQQQFQNFVSLFNWWEHHHRFSNPAQVLLQTVKVASLQDGMFIAFINFSKWWSVPGFPGLWPSAPLATVTIPYQGTDADDFAM